MQEDGAGGPGAEGQAGRRTGSTRTRSRTGSTRTRSRTGSTRTRSEKTRFVRILSWRPESGMPRSRRTMD